MYMFLPPASMFQALPMLTLGAFFYKGKKYFSQSHKTALERDCFAHFQFENNIMVNRDFKNNKFI